MLIFSLNLIGYFAGNQKKVLSLFLSQFFDEFFIHSSIYAKLLIFGIFFFYTRIIMLILHLI